MQNWYDQQLAAAIQAAQQASQQASASAASAAATPQQQGMIDTRLIGRPDSFDGGNTWRDWSTAFRSYASAVSSRFGDILTHAEAQTTPLLNATLDAADAALSTQLHFMTVMCARSRHWHAW